MKDKKIRYNDETRFTVVREVIINKRIGEDGCIYIQKSHIEKTPNPNKDFELGSIRKPKNKDIVELRWDIPSKRRESNPFDNIFKKFLRDSSI